MFCESPILSHPTGARALSFLAENDGDLVPRLIDPANLRHPLAIHFGRAEPYPTNITAHSVLCVHFTAHDTIKPRSHIAELSAERIDELISHSFLCPFPVASCKRKERAAAGKDNQAPWSREATNHAKRRTNRPG